MKNLLIGIALAAVVLTSVGAQQKPEAWEYKVIVGKCYEEKKLNALGAEGWELATYSTWGTSAGPIDTCAFKRHK